MLTKNVLVVVEFIAAIWPLVTEKYSPAALALIFALPLWAVQLTALPSPMTSHAEPSETTRIC
jgi:hypothetical protein